MQGNIETRPGATDQSTDANQTVDVAIVGCGPVGAVLAVLLGQRGHEVIVLERHRQRYPQPRAVHFDHEVARILQGCGLGEDIASLSEPAPIYEWRNADGAVLLRFGGRPVGPSGWPDFNMFWQPAIEARLEESASALRSVTVRRGVTVTDLTGPETDVAALPAGENAAHIAAAAHPLTTVHFDTEHGPDTIQARFVIGADGANSTVRQLIGSDVVDLGFFFDWLIVDVAPHEPRVYDPVNLQVCDPVRPTTVISGGPGRRRWEFMALPGETAADLDREETAWRLLEPWDITPANADLERHTVYRFNARWAESWRRGSVFLAGDAAHQMPPFAGQGMCSGIRDAANLAWKLDLVLRGLAGDALLDAYQVERESNVRAIIDLSMALGNVICVSDPKAAAERDEMMLAGRSRPDEITVPPPLPGVTNGVTAPDDPLAGTLFVQGRVVDLDGQARRADDVHGAGWRLVMIDQGVAAQLDSAPLQRFAGIGGQPTVIGPDVDVDGTYADYFTQHNLVAVVQRPDFSVFGAATSPERIGPLLDLLESTIDKPITSPSPTSSATPQENP